MGILTASSALLRLDSNRIKKGLKRRWMENTFPNGMNYRDELVGFDRLYLVRDPWSLDCESERNRFAQTNNVIMENFGRLSRLLEVGCGEGLQSKELQRVCYHLFGIDVSKRAIRRARRRCPQATFAVSDLFAFSKPAIGPFDLVTACEVLYYVSDVPTALRRLSDLGRACLVSYYDGMREVLDKHVGEVPGVRFSTVLQDDVSWTLAWWRT
jgi:SAM-dependent methyltransferase